MCPAGRGNQCGKNNNKNTPSAPIIAIISKLTSAWTKDKRYEVQREYELTHLVANTP